MSFEDPALKAALKRAVPGQAAPEALRQRIVKTLATPVPSRTARPWLPWAAAATLLLGAGLCAYVSWVTVGHHRAGPSVVAMPAKSVAILPDDLAQAIVNRHDTSAASANHPGNEDFPQIGLAMEQRLGYPVLAADLRSDGWTFDGATVCPVKNVKCGHLVFTKGTQSLSVISMPISLLLTSHDGDRYETTFTKHPIVVMSHDGSLFCLVGYCPTGELTVGDMERLLGGHISQTVTANAHAKPVTLTEAGVRDETDPTTRAHGN